ncbi:MAG: 50S ribosomal protein L21 [Deltaproteobacteria bacterium]|jgi:large subunit ribosomal protein L21|nr:50S ribosomal protein L21 [Deltaproteobacteria bacterium]
MYAIIESGGKQFRVVEGSRIRVEKLQAKVGSELVLDKVLLVGGHGLNLGVPYVQGAAVRAEVLGHGRGEKVLIFKKRRRNDSRKLKGHRQEYTALKITAISA